MNSKKTVVKSASAGNEIVTKAQIAAAKRSLRLTEKSLKRMEYIEGSTKLRIEIPTVFYEEILKRKLAASKSDMSNYITQLIALDLGNR